MSGDFATVTVPVNGVCEAHGCDSTAKHAFILTGDYGKDGIGVYCYKHAEEWGRKENTTALAEVDQ